MRELTSVTASTPTTTTTTAADPTTAQRTLRPKGPLFPTTPATGDTTFTSPQREAGLYVVPSSDPARSDIPSKFFDEFLVLTRVNWRLINSSKDV